MTPRSRAGGTGAATRPSPAPITPAPALLRRERFQSYEPLVTLAIGHEYYGDGEAWFEVAPAAESPSALARHGLLLRRDRGVVFVLGELSRRAELAGTPAGTGEWRTFRLDVTDRHFESVTDDGLAGNNARACLYFDGPEPGSAPPASDAPPVTLVGRPMLLLPLTLAVPRTPQEPIEVVNRAGRIIRRLEPTSATPPSEPARAVGRRGAPAEDPPALEQTRVDLSDLPAGVYAVRVGGRDVITGLLLHSAKVPTAFFEVRLPDVGAPPVRLAVRFAARRTHWKYTVVGRSGSGPLDGLSIAPAVNGAAMRGVTAPAFLGPFDATLANGATAQQFVSADPIPLDRRSRIRLRLNGRRKERMTREAVLIDALPTPDRGQLALLTDQDRERLGSTETFCSEMFVYV